MTTCPICHAAARRFYRWDPPYQLCHCQACQTLFADPLPDQADLDRFYQGFLYRLPDPRSIPARVRALEARLRQDFPRHLRPGRSFLDYGGGTGIASLAALQLGLDVTLCEIDRQALQFAAQLAGPHLHTCREPDQLPDNAFDLIYADNVIEHVPDPLALLRLLYSRLKPSGRLVLRTPRARNTELLFHPLVPLRGYLARIRRHNGLAATFHAAAFRPWNLDPPRHLYSFSPTSLDRLARQIHTCRHEVAKYHLRLWEYALTPRLARLRPRSAFHRALCWSVLPFVAPPELASKLLEILLRPVLTPAGLTLALEKP